MIEVYLNPFFQSGFFNEDDFAGPGSKYSAGIFPQGYGLNQPWYNAGQPLNATYSRGSRQTKQFRNSIIDEFATQYGNNYLTSVGTLNPLLRNITGYPIDIRSPDWMLPFRPVEEFFKNNNADFALGLRDPQEYFTNENSFNYYKQFQSPISVQRDFNISTQYNILTAPVRKDYLFNYLNYLTQETIKSMQLDSNSAGFLTANEANQIGEAQLDYISFINGNYNNSTGNNSSTIFAYGGLEKQTISQSGYVISKKGFSREMELSYKTSTSQLPKGPSLYDITRENRTIIKTFNMNDLIPLANTFKERKLQNLSTSNFYPKLVGMLETWGQYDDVKQWWASTTTTRNSDGSIIIEDSDYGTKVLSDYLDTTNQEFDFETSQFLDGNGDVIPKEQILADANIDSNFYDQIISDELAYEQEINEIKKALKKRRKSTVTTQYRLRGLKVNKREHFEKITAEMSGYVTSRSLRLLLDYDNKKQQYVSILTSYKPLVGYEPLLTISNREGETIKSLAKYRQSLLRDDTTFNSGISL